MSIFKKYILSEVNSMKAAKLLAALMAIVSALIIAGCCGGGNTTQEKQTQVTSQPTVGDQLQDLDKAYKSGAITKEEYDKLRKDVMDKAAQTK
jgi:hypothetical protein